MKNEIKEAIKTLEAATASCAAGDRHIAVLDRGWMFAGDMALDEETGVYTMTNCVNVRKWTEGGFGGLSRSATGAKAVLDKCTSIRFHRSALILAAPIVSDWDE